MDNTNPTGKSLSELIKDADTKGIQLILIEDEAAGLKHAELIATMSKKHEIMIIGIGDLPQADQDKIKSDMIIEKNKLAFERPPIPIKLIEHEPLPKIAFSKDDLNKQWYEKLSPSGKKRRRY